MSIIRTGLQRFANIFRSGQGLLSYKNYTLFTRD